MLLILSGIVWHALAVSLGPRVGLVRPNFAAKNVLASYGIAAFGYVAAITACLALLDVTQWERVRLYLAVMGAMWALGALDDVFGSREVGGFGGHFRKLVLERKLTTGAVKAVGGGAVGVTAGYYLFGQHPWLLAGTALVIPLAANTLNLLDLRPGRALGVFFLALGVTCVTALGRLQAPWVVGTVAAVAAAFGIADSRGKAMMGDSWSNALGAALGLTMALDTPFLMPPAIGLFAAIHVYSEKHSISRLIERNRVLGLIDRRLGVR